MERTPKAPPRLPKSNEPEAVAFLESDRMVLLVCLGLALGFWLITKLSYTYQDTIVLQLDYNIPDDRVFTFPPVHQLEVTVNGTGWELLRLAFGQQQILTIPVSPDESRMITTSSWTGKISKVLSHVKTLNIQPETIRLKTEVTAQKTVPIVLDHQVRLAPMHQLVDTFQITLNTVEITGPASVVRDIKAWKTAILLPPEPISKDLNITLPLVREPSTNLTFSVEEVRCVAAVEELTEKQLSVPVEIINAPQELLLVLLPKTIEVIAQVGLSDYDRLSAAEFKAVADFSTINLYEERSVRVSLRYQPDYVSNVQYSPRKLDYIIRSKNL